MMLVVELLPEQLCVRAIHRVLGRIDGVDLRTALSRAFTVTAAGPNDADGVTALEAAMRAEAGLGLVDAEGLALLTPTPALERSLADLPAPLPGVDSARFEAGVLPAIPDVTLEVPGRRRHRGRGGGEGPRRGGRPPAPRGRRHHPRRGRRGGADAREDHLLLAEATHGHGLPQPRPRVRPQ